jgi:prolyl 4-hydroxylase
VRTSDAAAFPLAVENPAIHALNRRLATLSGTAVSQGEPLQVLRYRPGQEYRPHGDAFPPGVENQRILTVLVYLNSGYSGGETHFVVNGLSIKGDPGDALLFRNTLPDGNFDPRTKHAGLPVTSGTKFIASRWIRAQPIDPAKPAY